MKNLNNVRDEISEILTSAGKFEHDSKEKRLKQARVRFLKNASLYLESSPSVEFIEKQAESLKKRLADYRKRASETERMSASAAKQYKKRLHFNISSAGGKEATRNDPVHPGVKIILQIPT